MIMPDLETGATTSESPVPPAAQQQFTVFNVKANRKLQKEFLEKQERDRAYIAELEKLLHEKGVEIPEHIHEFHKADKGRGRKVSFLMEDGSLAALSKVVERHAEHTHRYEIQVQYRHLTFWNEVLQKKIPTVGSSLRNLFVGSGKKHRVNIINDLTGRILPKRMTLVMGPPGCGE